jgi:nuclear GTP-binding protein
VEQLAKDAGKKVLLALNKIGEYSTFFFGVIFEFIFSFSSFLDTCPRKALTAWVAHLRTQCFALMFRSASAFLPKGPTMQDPWLKKAKRRPKIP